MLLRISITFNGISYGMAFLTIGQNFVELHPFKIDAAERRGGLLVVVWKGSRVLTQELLVLRMRFLKAIVASR